jgi:hypothetical protein
MRISVGAFQFADITCKKALIRQAETAKSTQIFFFKRMTIDLYEYRQEKVCPALALFGGGIFASYKQEEPIEADANGSLCVATFTAIDAIELDDCRIALEQFEVDPID